MAIEDIKTETIRDMRRRQKAMRNLNETVKEISEEGSSEKPDQYFLNRLRKQYLNQEKRAMKRGGNREKITQYRKTVGYYVRL